QADHVAACDRVPGGMRIDEPDAGPPRLAVEQRGERDGHEVAALHRDHGRIPASQKVFGGAVPHVARVLHVIRDPIGAPELVADVLGDERRLHAEVLQSGCDLCLEDLADVHLGDADVPVGVTFDFVHRGQIARLDVEYDALGNHGDAVAPSVTQTL